MKQYTLLAKKVDADVRSRLVDICHHHDGSISDLFNIYEFSINKIQTHNSFKYYDKPSHIHAKAYHITLRYFGYERNSLP
jgi:hypothetical protein